ncbi:hypothetical protein GTZ78_04260 [Streptomyces sp. SID8361]|uniref:hypothetical protein n=1 Tax=Streptomyces sp. MnatMP-M27 TaxID=1839768 RepID=UPI00081F162D|nr:hypothetical protein [Streptomyces sp. MnatMP-M27]MYU09927.1 hypothetical protein [Streptomyces sp. SID8361]SCF66583.1 hypothetical protein GA0115260_100954 [Streptomyces sp. MnatMP-M27]
MTAMTELDDAAIERILTMVDASARAVAEDEHQELFEEFAEEMRAARRVPGAGEFFDDLSGAPAVDTHVYLTIGLSLLGQIAFKVLSTATDMAVQRGVRDAVGYLRRCLRGDATEDGTDTREDGDSTAGLARRVTVELRLPPEVDPDTVRAVVRIQAEALIRSESGPDDGTDDSPGEGTDGGPGDDADGGADGAHDSADPAGRGRP